MAEQPISLPLHSAHNKLTDDLNSSGHKLVVNIINVNKTDKAGDCHGDKNSAYCAEYKTHNIPYTKLIDL
jgi:hypothetical protein